LKRRLNTTPTQIGIRDALTDDLLEVSHAFCLDLLALRLPFFARNAEFVFLRNVVLLSFAIDGSDNDLGQLDALYEGIEKDDCVVQ